MAELLLEHCYATYDLRNPFSPDDSFRGTLFLLHRVRREHGRKYDDEERDPIANGDWKHPWCPRLTLVGYGVNSTPNPP